MRLEIRDISLTSVLKVGCCVHTIIASVPALLATLLTLSSGDVLISPTWQGRTLAFTYLSAMAWLGISIIAGGLAWVFVAVLYNLVASVLGGIVIDLRRVDPKPAPAGQAEQVRSRYENEPV